MCIFMIILVPLVDNDDDDVATDAHDNLPPLSEIKLLFGVGLWDTRHKLVSKRKTHRR